MFISTYSILSFATSLAILPSALGAAITDLDPFDQPIIRKRDEVNYVWSIANGDIAPVRITSNFQYHLSYKESTY